MKTMTCRQLGGACDLEFSAETFEEIAKKSQEHGMEMAKVQDKAHLEIMEEMRELMLDPAAMRAWMHDKEETFNSLPEN